MITPEGTHTRTHIHTKTHAPKYTSPHCSQGITLHSLPDFRQVLLLFVGAFGSTVLDCSISVHLYQLDTSNYVFLVVCCRPNAQGPTVPVQDFSIWMRSIWMFYGCWRMNVCTWYSVSLFVFTRVCICVLSWANENVHTGRAVDHVIKGVKKLCVCVFFQRISHTVPVPRTMQWDVEAYKSAYHQNEGVGS